LASYDEIAPRKIPLLEKSWAESAHGWAPFLKNLSVKPTFKFKKKLNQE
jgi:hypothetical protein